MPSGGMSSKGFNVKSGVSRKKFSITGEAFGVGAYEEEDDDVYNRFVMKFCFVIIGIMKRGRGFYYDSLTNRSSIIQPEVHSSLIR